MSRRLIVNADDFGESEAVNRAVIRAHTQGIVTSTSLIVTGAAFEDAVARAREHPTLAVGLHVTLVHGRPCLPPEAVALLVTPERRLPLNATVAGLRWFLDRRAWAQIREEIWCQVDRFLSTGLTMDHLDGHLHFHVHPAVMFTLIEVAREIGVPRVRLPWEPWWRSLPLDTANLATKLAYAFIFTAVAWYYRPRLRAAGIRFPDAVFGVLQTGHMVETYWLRLLECLPPGISEAYTHPRLDTVSGLAELHALTSPRVRQRVEQLGIQLTTYGEAFQVTSD